MSAEAPQELPLVDVTSESPSPGHVRLLITVPASEVDKAYDEVLDKNLSKVKLKGFRKGHVPGAVARAQVPDKALTGLVSNHLIPPAYKAALARLNLRPLGRGDSKVVECERGKDLVFEATLQVMPIQPVHDYKAVSFVELGLDKTNPKDRETIANTIIARVVEQIDFNVLPPQLREGHAKLALKKREQALKEFGISLEKHLRQKGLSPQQFAEEVSLSGLIEARLEVLYRSIASAEGITVGKSELENAILLESSKTGEKVESFRKKLEDDQTNRLFIYRILIGKVRQLLVESALTEASPVPEPAVEPVSKKKRGTAKAKPKAKSKPKAKAAAKSEASDQARAEGPVESAGTEPVEAKKAAAKKPASKKPAGKSKKSAGKK